MITPELIVYIRGELVKGRTREEIHKALIAGGGWNEADLSEAFREIIPIKGLGDNSATASSSFPAKSSSLWKIVLAIATLGAFCLVAWFYRAPLVSLWNSSINNIKILATSYFGDKKTADTNNSVVMPQDDATIKEITKEIASVKNCGVGVSPDLKNPLTRGNDEVLTCLGNSALHCEDAQAVLKDPLFPSVFQIIKDEDACNFRLSYEESSTLVDATGKELAGQYISCPIDIVKAIDESNPKSPKFQAPDKNDLSKYASEIYLYGIIGVFMENNILKDRVEALGCTGPYIDSVVASYVRIQDKK